MIDLDRSYGGINVRWRVDREWGTGRLTASAGLASDRQDEWRRGFDNFTGPATTPSRLGVIGRLRRDESNIATTLDPYAQIEWESAAWTATAGLRRSRVRMTSTDNYVVVGNPDDSGASEYAATMPVLGLRYRLSDTLQAYASTGLGFETPTLNEVAHQASGASGLNSQLQASRNSEVGLRARYAEWGWTGTVFDTRTYNEIAVLSNTGGWSTFQNAGCSLRQGLEISADGRWGGVSLTSALTFIEATYGDSFKTCATSFNEEAGAYTVLNLDAKFQQTSGAWQLNEFVRIDNVTNRVYSGSVIVSEGNGRYFEAAAGRSAFVGVELHDA